MSVQRDNYLLCSEQTSVAEAGNKTVLVPSTLSVPTPFSHYDMVSLSHRAFHKVQLATREETNFFLAHTCHVLQ